MSVASTANGPARTWPAACDLRSLWLKSGYLSVWLRSDGTLSRPRFEPTGQGDDFRRSGRDPRTARRIDLTDKRASASAIADAIRNGQRFADMEKGGSR